MEPGVGIGMRRLSIIDLKTGHQPLSQRGWFRLGGLQRGNLQLSRTDSRPSRPRPSLRDRFRHRDARASLRGTRRPTASVTCEACSPSPFGMHGGARCSWRGTVWGSSRSTTPQTARGLVFGSELKALIASPWVQREIDPGALAAYLRFGYVPDPLSILKGVVKLPPGHVVLVKEGRVGRPQRYWKPTSYFAGASKAARRGRGWVTAVGPPAGCGAVPPGERRARGCLPQRRRRLERRGGPDGTRRAGCPSRRFSVGYRETEFDEAPYARRVAEWFGTEHHELIATPQRPRSLDDVLVACDEPFADASAIPTYLVARLARQHVKVVLSGDGGDELFAGYDRYLVDQRESAPRDARRSGPRGAAQARQQRSARRCPRQELPSPLLPAPDGGAISTRSPCFRIEPFATCSRPAWHLRDSPLFAERSAR